MQNGKQHAFLEGLPAEQREQLVRVNGAGLSLLRELLSSGEAIAFLGAGVSMPLYPLWDGVIREVVEAASDRLSDEETKTCLELATSNPDAVVEIVRRQLGAASYREVLRSVFRPRRFEESGRTWTPTHERIVRCNFAGVVTTNYDPGIVDARMAVRPGASSTGFGSWTDEDTLDRWRTGDVFSQGEELPVLFAHGHHNQPDAIVLATTDYRRAYAGKLGRVLARLVDGGHLVWIGFSFGDQRIAAILREVAEESGTTTEPGAAPRHVALMPWDPVGDRKNGPNDPGVLRSVAEIHLGSHVVLYPAPKGNHSALLALLEELTDSRFPPVEAKAPPAVMPATTKDPKSGPAMHWLLATQRIHDFTGRAVELARLDRWAQEEEVRLVGVTAWGGAGKTTLVSEWLNRHRGAFSRPGIKGVFAWSFYENATPDRWAEILLRWMEATFRLNLGSGPLAIRVLSAARAVPLVLFLDGLEVMQEGPAGSDLGRLLDGTLRTVLTQWCQGDNGGLALLTSRFAFADLERFDGTAARMLDVPPLTPDEGAELLVQSAGWLDETARRDLVRAVDGHALAVRVLARTLDEQIPTSDLQVLTADLRDAIRTDDRVARVIEFYADRLTPADKQLVGLVSLFQRPVSVQTLLALGESDVLLAPLRGWTAGEVQQAAQHQLSGLLDWHSEISSVSAHPLVRDVFRSLVMTPASAQLASDVALADLPRGTVTSREDALRVIEMIELLIDADEWTAADDLYGARTDDGQIWKHLPAARLGYRCALAFVADDRRRKRCAARLGDDGLLYYINRAALLAMNSGDVIVAEQFLRAATELARANDERSKLVTNLHIMAESLAWLGYADRSREIAAEAVEIAQADGEERAAGRARLGHAHSLAGETTLAEQQFIRADLRELTESGLHLISLRGSSWGELLVRTRRQDAARRLSEKNREIGISQGWNEDIARCDRLLAICDLETGEVDVAGERLARAVDTFRDGDYLLELAKTLVAVAEQQRRLTKTENAERSCAEAIDLAGPRELVPTLGAALAARARVRGDHYAALGDVLHLERARDDADHAIRLGTKTRRLPWLELDGLDAHAYLDAIEGRDQGWTDKANALRAILIPDDLDPDPLSTAEALMKEAADVGHSEHTASQAEETG